MIRQIGEVWKENGNWYVRNTTRVMIFETEGLAKLISEKIIADQNKVLAEKYYRVESLVRAFYVTQGAVTQDQGKLKAKYFDKLLEVME